MSRRLRLATVELGFLELYLIYRYGERFEADWAPLEAHGISGLFTYVSKDTMDHALRGFTRPLVHGLGLAPVGCLRKLPVANRECEHRVGCQFYDRAGCVVTAKKLPPCFQPAGVEGDVARQLGHDVVALWREGVFIVVVTEPT